MHRCSYLAASVLSCTPADRAEALSVALVLQAALQQGTDRQGGPQQPAQFGSAEALAFSSNAAANFGQDFRTLVRPHPQYHQLGDSRSVPLISCI